MPATTKIPIDWKVSGYTEAEDGTPTGRAYPKTHPVSYSPDLIRTGFPDNRADFYRSVEILAGTIAHRMLPANTRFFSSAEAQALWRSYENQSKDPRNEEDFNDIFGKNGWYVLEETSTALRTPEGWIARKDKGTGKYPRTVVETDIPKAVKLLNSGAGWKDIGDSVNRKVAEIQVPFSWGHVVREVDDFGIPIGVEATVKHIAPYALHAFLKLTPELDPISGHYDVAVRRRSGRLHAANKRCPVVAASYERWHTNSNSGFRPVRGSVLKAGKSPLTKIA